jgi:hypothetical protein
MGIGNYIVRECTSETTYIISADTLNVDDVISFYFEDETINCGVVVGTTDAEHDYVFNQTETSCCDCLTANTSYLSFTFERCDNTDSIYVSITTFCDTYGGLPISGSVWNLLNLETSENICATFISPSVDSGVTVWEPYGEPFDGCGDCNISIPTSAGTETLICVEICGPSGTTVTQVVPPHPVWTNGYGTQVTQLNMVVLGGPNGLNS